jgi:hypothetical protein
MTSDDYKRIPTYDGEDVKRHEKSSKVFKTVMAGFLLLLASLAVFSTSKTQLNKDATSLFTTKEDAIQLYVTNDDYELPSSLSTYGFDLVAEPFRTTTIKVTNPSSSDSSFLFTLSTTDGEEVASTLGTSFEFSVDKGGMMLTLTVEELADSSDKSSVIRSSSFKVPCKYVRREIRKLSEDDLNSFFKAMNIMYTMPMPEGSSIYGPEFTNYKAISLKHMSYNFGNEVCTPFHNADSFYTSHTAFSYETEKSLQSIVPSIALPYWDYFIDSELYGTDWLEKSPIFSNDMLGHGNPDNDYVVDKGPLAYSKISRDLNISMTNSYGYVTAYFNNNPSEYVQRADEYCGLPQTDMSLPSCFEASGIGVATTLTELQTAVGDDYHAIIHEIMGGVFNCPYTPNELIEKYPEAEELLETLTVSGVNFWNSGYESGSLTCPDTCDLDTPFEDCMCYCSSIDVNGISREDASEFISSTDAILNQLSPVEDYLWVDEETGLWTVLGDDDMSAEIVPWIVQYACSPGVMAPFTASTSSTNDPIFPISHNAYERFYHYYRVSSDQTDFDWSWTDDETCYGRSWNDTLPFYNFDIGPEFLDADQPYTNELLFNIFDPNREELPYIYEDVGLSWCDDYL